MLKYKDLIYHDKIHEFNDEWDAIPFSLSFKSTMIIRSVGGKDEIKERLNEALKLKGKTLIGVQWKSQRAIVEK